MAVGAASLEARDEEESYLCRDKEKRGYCDRDGEDGMGHGKQWDRGEGKVRGWQVRPAV